METLHDVLSIDENAKFLNAPEHIEILSDNLRDLTIKQAYDAANVLGISPSVLVVRIMAHI